MSKKIRLILKNEMFQTVGTIAPGSKGLTFSSLEWESKFYKPDTFHMQCPIVDSRDLKQIMRKEVCYLIRNDTAQIAYIQEKKHEDGKHLELSGVGLEGLLAKRFTTEEEFLPINGGPYGDREGCNYVGRVMCDIINSNYPFGTGLPGGPWLVANDAENHVGVSIYASTTVTGNVLKIIETLASAYDVGFKTVYNAATGKVHFTTIGITPYGQEIPGRVQWFSDRIGNAKKMEYGYDNSKYFNYVRVIGDDSQTAIVDRSQGRERYEVSIKAKVKKRNTVDTATYSQLLYAEGERELAKRREKEFFTVQPNELAHVELGWEVRNSSNALSLASVSFCSEVKETWENGYKREYTVGYPTDMQEDFVTLIQGEFEL